MGSMAEVGQTRKLTSSLSLVKKGEEGGVFLLINRLGELPRGYWVPPPRPDLLPAVSVIQSTQSENSNWKIPEMNNSQV